MLEFEVEIKEIVDELADTTLETLKVALEKKKLVNTGELINSLAVSTVNESADAIAAMYLGFETHRRFMDMRVRHNESSLFRAMVAFIRKVGHEKFTYNYATGRPRNFKTVDQKVNKLAWRLRAARIKKFGFKSKVRKWYATNFYKLAKQVQNKMLDSMTEEMIRAIEELNKTQVQLNL